MIWGGKKNKDTDFSQLQAFGLPYRLSKGLISLMMDFFIKYNQISSNRDHLQVYWLISLEIILETR